MVTTLSKGGDRQGKFRCYNILMTRKPTFRFTIKTLLVILLVVGAFFVGHLSGSRVSEVPRLKNKVTSLQSKLDLLPPFLLVRRVDEATGEESWEPVFTRPRNEAIQWHSVKTVPR